MKVTVADFSNAVAKFEAKWLETVNSPGNKFFAAAALHGANAGIGKMLEPFTSDGLVDVDAIKGMVNAGLDAADGKLVLTPAVDPLLARIGIGFDEVRFTRADFDEFFNGLAQYGKS